MKRGTKRAQKKQRDIKARKLKNLRLFMRLGFPIESMWYLNQIRNGKDLS